MQVSTRRTYRKQTRLSTLVARAEALALAYQPDGEAEPGIVELIDALDGVTPDADLEAEPDREPNGDELDEAYDAEACFPDILTFEPDEIAALDLPSGKPASEPPLIETTYSVINGLNVIAFPAWAVKGGAK